MMQAHMTGARLAFVVVPQEGTVMRKVNKWTKKGIQESYVEQPAGFMVYFPRGHVIRLRDKTELRRYKLDRPARIINLEGLSDPNSAIGKMMMAQDDATRKGAFQSLEEQVIKIATAASGKVELTRDPRDLPTHEEALDE